MRLDENDLQPKVEQRLGQTRDGKMLLREALRSLVPEDVVDRVKQGFSGPDATWFRGESVEFVKRQFGDDARIYEYLRPDTVRAVIEEHTSGQHNRRLFIWSLLMLETWLGVFADSQVPTAMAEPAPTVTAHAG